jgi:hypothetical protein
MQVSWEDVRDWAAAGSLIVVPADLTITVQPLAIEPPRWRSSRRRSNDHSCQ